MVQAATTSSSPVDYDSSSNGSSERQDEPSTRLSPERPSRPDGVFGTSLAQQSEVPHRDRHDSRFNSEHAPAQADSGTLSWKPLFPASRTTSVVESKHIPLLAADAVDQRQHAQQDSSHSEPVEKPLPNGAAHEDLPLPPQPNATINVPLNDPSWHEKVQLSGSDDRISLKVREAPLNVVLALLAEQHRLNIVTADQLSQPISVTLTNVSLDRALDAITLINGCTWARQGDIILVTAIGDEKKSSPILQGQIIQVFPLNYVLATDVDKIVKGLLSPVGLSFANQTSPTDQRKTSEQIVVQDLPAYVQRVASYIQQIDQPPRQVMVEAHVLQVDLKGDYAHGVNFQALLRVAGAPVTFGTIGFADPTATTTSFFRINATDLNTLIQCLTTTTDAKTLATPKVVVLNGQESKIQIGSKLGYKTLQTTQTATLENVQFLDTGVILRVTPNISQDGQVLLSVKPEVSDGLINPVTGLPDSNTTEVDTKVLLADGEALVIGGLIKEGDSETITKIPYLGDAKYVGYFFQRRTVARKRTETIIALLPRVIPDAPGLRQCDCTEIIRSATPLLHRDINQVERRQWEPPVPKDWPRQPPVVFGDVPMLTGGNNSVDNWIQVTDEP
jgi:type IV pilus assembly protein PilQ